MRLELNKDGTMRMKRVGNEKRTAEQTLSNVQHIHHPSMSSVSACQAL